MSDQQPQDRVLTVPNVLSVLRLALIPLFAWLLLGEQSYGWATAVLMFSGASDWADGKIARLLNQYSRLGELLDPAVDRIYMVVVPVLFAVAHLVPWWVIAVLMGRDLILAALLPLIRRHGVSALPVIYLGKAATFALMSAFPLILLGDLLHQRGLEPFGLFEVTPMALIIVPVAALFIMVAAPALLRVLRDIVGV